jgi:hypothetical protein
MGPALDASLHTMRGSILTAIAETVAETSKTDEVNVKVDEVVNRVDEVRAECHEQHFSGLRSCVLDPKYR